MNVINQLQQAIVYIEDRLLEPFDLQELSDYVGLSPYHLEQAFKMILGLSPKDYHYARKMTVAAHEILHTSGRLIDLAKRFGYPDMNQFAHDFSSHHDISPIQVKTKQDRLNIQKRLYIKLSATEKKPYRYKLENLSDISLVGQSRFVPTDDLSQHFLIPDFLEDLSLSGDLDDIIKYNDCSPHELFVVSCPLDNGLELFIGVPSERYPDHLESRLLPERHYAMFNLEGEIDYVTTEAWHYIETRLELNLPYERDSLYVEVYPLDLSFDHPYTKAQLWVPIQKDNLGMDEDII
ncbi:AraC family transcriptional regulator [Staphylococcus massiliensis]|uniref:AraC family transcriptional regulator n=1 Tax=Staphylococcus massiliensis S46 TaxID=1229783 RepID=K9B4U3_9STAP|nr:AraC family transcriptional regulator [Staphylococcus massiliensis]EKU49827.1 AraC family transcriptional regulator [Staphylococcus massiliensis S46]MCG3398933.1 AraC family transcriptional regulator [Staphylococcus massiliensis]MCG3401065.1 AraC family transcriptional regulator [Staphylococcus massiliensis]MCG3413477.1 AraC family transcriptional regulator [Staphylococcus massiliensis]PNZ99297.1 AraC family transcriptional regulator [Staphylococcus massiliensis CCUG 55927]